MISKDAMALADKELKITLLLLFSLLAVSFCLLTIFTQQTFFSFVTLKGYIYFSLLLTPYILFGSQKVALKLSGWISGSYWRKWIFSLYILSLSTIFSFFSQNFNPYLSLKILFWLAVPVGILSVRYNPSLGWREALAILLLWLPIEFNAFTGLDIILAENVSIPALPFIASSYGLFLFTILRPTPKVGFSFLFTWKDILTALASLIGLALLLIPLGTTLGFIHFSSHSVSVIEVSKLFLGIYFLVALPEEILFRGLIQNLCSQYLEKRNMNHAGGIALLTASLLFGISHINNNSPPSWNYVLLATGAGLFYGFTYLKTSKCTVSALVHCGVNLFWAIFFSTTAG